PKFTDLDLRNRIPRTAVQRAVFGDDVPDLRKYDPRRFNPGVAMRDAILGEDEPDEPDEPVSMTKEPSAEPNGKPLSMTKQPAAEPNGNQPRPRPKPGPGRTYDSDAT